MTSVCIPQVSSEQHILLIKTTNDNTIITKYFPNKTNVQNVLDTLLRRVKFAVSSGGEHRSESPKLSLSFNGTMMADLTKDLSYYGISSKIEMIYLKYIIPRTNTNEISTNLNSTSVAKDIIKRTTVFNGNRRELQDWAMEKGKSYRVHGGSKSSEIRRAIISHGDIAREIYIKTLTGKTITLTVPQNVKLEELRCCVEYKEGIPPAQSKLVMNGLCMEDGNELETYVKRKLLQLGNKDTDLDLNFDNATIHLILCLRGGMYSEESGKNGSYSSLEKLGTTIYEIYSNDLMDNLDMVDLLDGVEPDVNIIQIQTKG